jgi:hypothetical protein
VLGATPTAKPRRPDATQVFHSVSDRAKALREILRCMGTGRDTWDAVAVSKPVGGSLAFRAAPNECANSSRSSYYLHGE